MRRLLLLAALAVLALAQLPKPSGGGGGGSSSGCIASGTAIQKGNGAGGCIPSSVTDNGTVVATIEGMQAKSLVLGDGNSSAIDYMQGKTSGGIAWGVTDTAAASPIVLLMPNASPAASQFLQAVAAPAACSGLTATFAAGSPSNCVQTQWTSNTAAEIFWGNFGVSPSFTNGTTNFVQIGGAAIRTTGNGEGTATTTTTRAGTISKVYIHTNGTNGASSLTFTLRVNGADCTTPSTISVPVAASAVAGNYSDLTHACTFAAGDQINIEAIVSNGGAAVTVATNYALEIAWQ